MTDLKSYPVVAKYKALFKNVKNNKLSNKYLNEKLDNLKTNVRDFYEIFSNDLINEIFEDDLNEFFTKIEVFIDSFKKNADYISTIDADSPGYKLILKMFRNDLDDFSTILSNFALSQAEILKLIIKMKEKKINKKKIQRVTKQFHLEISLFHYSYNIQPYDIPPYYQINCIPSYKFLHNEINSTTKKFLNIIGPHGSGKTLLIPLFLASRSLGFTISSRYVILIENKIEEIPEIEKTFNKINSESEGKFLVITSSLHDFVDIINEEENTLQTTIAILTPFDALKLIHKEIKITHEDVTFLKKSTFIIDDINQRKVEADVLSQDILDNVFNLSLKNEIAKFVIVGNYSDKRFLNIFGRHYDNIEITVDVEDIKEKIIKCNNYNQICKLDMCQEITKFLSKLTENKKVDIGSILTFVPNIKTGKSIFKRLFNAYNKKDSLQIFLVQIKINKGESLENLNRRLLDDINKIANERTLDDDYIKQNVLFIHLLDLTGFITEEEKNFVNSNLPLPFINKNFVRLIITTNKNESLLKVPDVTAIFDSALTETEYYDSKKSVSFIQLEQLPNETINQRNILLNKNKKNIHFIFTVNDEKKKKETPPFVQRFNLDKSILLLRKIDIDFEKQRNLPNEPLTENVSSAMKKLSNIGFIDKEGKLTELGLQTSNFTSVSPNLALAILKYEKNQEFAFLVSLIIERAHELITNSRAQLLHDHFCPESDVVTILESILALNTSGDEINEENCGFSINTLESIYMTMANTFEKEGKEAVNDCIQWAKDQGTLQMVDDYVKLLDQDNYIEIRKASFVYICGVGAGSDPTAVYKANKILNFDKDTDAFIKFSKRPGWNGLQTPGNIIALSFQVENSSKINRGFLLHHDISIEEKDKNLGIVSLKVDQFLNSIFFIALFEAFWNRENKLTPIYHSYKPKKETAFLIHINENNDETYLSYCPQTLEAQNEMNNAIPFLSALVPYVPRSIVVRCDTPACGVELISYGVSNQFDHRIFLVDQPDLPKPFAYPVNKDTLKFAIENINELSCTHPRIRFSITGESIFYKFNDKTQIEADYSYPNVDPNIKSVFCSQQSHLVFLVDEAYGKVPDGVALLPWVTKDEGEKKEINKKDDFDLVVNISSKMMNGLGIVEKTNDLFLITLNGGFPTVKEGEIPEIIQNQVGFKDGVIRGGFYQLVKQIEKNYLKDEDLFKPIPLKTIGSTEECKKYNTEELQQDIIKQIKTEIPKKFGIPGLKIDATFIDNSILCLSIFNLPPETISHPPPTDMFDYSYHQCEADKIIIDALNTLSVPVSTITHEPTFTIIAQHFNRFKTSQAEFEEKITNVCEKFGFLNYTNPIYNEGGHDHESDLKGVIGEITIDLIGESSCIACASLISQEYTTMDANIGMTVTMTMDAMTTMKTLKSLDPRKGKIPRISPMNNVIHFPECEKKALKELIGHKKKWIYNEEYQAFIYPADDDEEVRKRLRSVREKDKICCLMVCGMDEPELLPQCIYAKEKDGTINAYGICKDCAISLIQNYEDIQDIYNPVTHLLDQDALSNIKRPLQGLGLLAESVDDKGDCWPQIPIGQIVWAFMSDKSGVLTSFVKAWFTIMVEFLIQTCGLFLYCPNHKKFPILRPDVNHTVYCNYCDMIYCQDCDSWHPRGAECTKGLPGVKRCPNCHAPSEKISGCNHVHCYRCGTNWDFGTGARR